MKTLENKFYNIHSIINANTIPMVDGSKWIIWSLGLLKDGYTLRRVNKAADILTRLTRI